MKLLEITSGTCVTLARPEPFSVSVENVVHEFDAQSINAVNSALASGRPLLVRGEPGVGKTQLAEAAAEALNRAFIRFTVDARTEARDLLWRFDAVTRLAEAQVLGAVAFAATGNRDSDGKARDAVMNDLRQTLAVRNFVRPGPLWWAVNAEDAQKHCVKEENQLAEGHNAQRAANGWVVLIDEIDKAESDLPNGLLEVLGSGSFRPLGRTDAIAVSEGSVAPLVVVTTNEDRVLPDAFVRRCMVLHLELPGPRDKLIQHLIDRGSAHFGGHTTEAILRKAAEMLVEDRQTAKSKRLSPLPGQAEYLDLVRAVVNWEGDKNKQDEIIEKVRAFSYRKHESMLTPSDRGIDADKETKLIDSETES